MQPVLELANLAPEPYDEWQRLLRFVGWGTADVRAASRSIEALFRRGPELVVETYDYLRHVPETAAILGWEQDIDEAHLEERRRFFTVWLARTLGLDTSAEFAEVLFRAGKYHAGHGPRAIHTPPAYVAGSMGLVQAAFARYLAEAELAGEVLAPALAAWSKYLAAQTNQMLFGYQVARDLSRGGASVQVSLFGRLRGLAGRDRLAVSAASGAPVADVLVRVFNYYPQIRREALDRVWRSDEPTTSLWVNVQPVYTPRDGWRVLLNGRDLAYDGGFASPVNTGDEVALFPPGR